VGTMGLEFQYLSRISGDPIFADKVEVAMDHIFDRMPADGGLFPNYINPVTGDWGANETSVGALGDSFYEYLYKVWALEGKPAGSPARDRYDRTMSRIDNKLVQVSNKQNIYIAEAKGGQLQHKMGHLACFMGGLYAISGADAPTQAIKDRYAHLGAGITETCRKGYTNSPVGLGPEEMHFNTRDELSSPNQGSRYYILRPEVVESYFYLWRTTKDPKYREWAWDMVQALETNARCGGGGGYCGIKDVRAAKVVHDDVQQSFFLAETLKYLYLIFSDDDAMDLDRWVLNTEAHPLPVLSDLPRSTD